MAQKNLWDEFGSCYQSDCPSGSECCLFTDNKRLNGDFCMTEKQKAGQYNGFYTDEFDTEFNWKCKEPEGRPSNNGGGSTNSGGSNNGGSSNNYYGDQDDDGTEYVDDDQVIGDDPFSADVTEYIEEHPWYEDYL